MAKIILNVEINSAPAKQQLKSLQNLLQVTADAVNKIEVNKDLTAQINAVSRLLKNTASAAAKLTNTNDKSKISEEKLAAAKQKTREATARAEKATEQLKAAREKLNKVTKQSTQLNKENQESNKEGQQSILSMAEGFLKWQISATLVMKPLNLIKDAISSINEVLIKTEDTVIDIKRVLGEDIENNVISDKLYEIAINYGQTFENVSEVATNFARAGMDWNDTVKATEAAILALNVAELDAAQASDGLIAVMSQFHYKAEDLTLVIDMLNKTADNFPVTTEKLLLALQRTGSSADNANLSLQETIGLITALSKATGRSGENLGTAVNSLIQYSSKSSSLDIFASLSDETSKIVADYRKGGATILDVWQEVSKVIKNANEEQAAILNNLANQEDIQNLSSELQDELGDIFETTQDVYGTANTFRKNYFIALLDNMDTVNGAIEIASDAAGYSQKENEQYMDTYTAKVTALKSQWEAFANDEHGFLAVRKGLVDIASTILTLIKYTGGLRTVLIAAATAAWALWGTKAIAALDKLVDGVKAVFDAIKKGAISANSALGVIGLIATAASVLIGIYQSIKSATDKTSSEYAEEAQAAKDEIEELQDKLRENYKLIEEANAAGGNKSYITRLQAENEELQRQIDLLKIKYYEEHKEAGEKAYKTLTDWRSFMEGYGKSFYVDDSIVQNPDATIADVLDFFISDAEKTGKVYDELSGIISSVVKEMENLNLEDAEQKALYDELVPLLDRYRAIYAKKGVLEDKSSKATKQWASDLSEVPDKYKDISDAIDKMNDEQEKANALAEKQNAVAQAQLKLQEAIAQARRDYITKVLEEYISDLEQAATLEEKQNAILKARHEAMIDALKEQKDAKEDTLDLEEKQLEVEKARKALEDAKNNRNVRVFNAQTGTWEYQANQKDVSSAQDSLDSAVKELADFIHDSAWDEVIEALENGAESDEVHDILVKWEKYGFSGSQEIIDVMNGDYEATEKVQSAVESLHDYLKNQAISEIKAKISDGNISMSDVDGILQKWMGYGSGSILGDWQAGVRNQIQSAIWAVSDSSSPIIQNTSAVKSAIENLNSKIVSLQSYLYQSFVQAVQTGLAGSSFSSKELYNLAAHYRSLGLAESSIQSIINLAFGTGKVDRKPRTYSSVAEASWWSYHEAMNDGRTYDEGGILNGMGGIKACKAPETVLNPALTSQILKPSSNAAFSNFAKSLGMLFGVSDKIASDKGKSAASAITNNSSSYVVNGVPIRQEYAERYTIKELFDTMAMLNQT